MIETACFQYRKPDPKFLTTAYHGYPAFDSRIPIAELPLRLFEHEMAWY